jgi:hypothetical protein
MASGQQGMNKGGADVASSARYYIMHKIGFFGLMIVCTNEKRKKLKLVG